MKGILILSGIFFLLTLYGGYQLWSLMFSGQDAATWWFVVTVLSSIMCVLLFVIVTVDAIVRARRK